MLSNFFVGRFYDSPSTISKLNPLSKMISTLIFIVMTILAKDLRLSIALFSFVFVLVLNTRIPLRVYFKTVWSIKFLILFMIIINLILKVELTIIAITVLKIINIVLYTAVLTLTTSPLLLAKGIEKILSPLNKLKIPVKNMALSLTLAIRFIPTIINEANKILKSQASRGVDFYSKSIKDKLSAVKNLLIPMFILSLKRADELSLIMEVRLFNLKSDRTNYREERWSFIDTYTIFVHLFMLVIIIAKGII
ncbi:MAG TPA: energy-coupling factor transporter transmembrane protein EcfT [Tenericutes bacterium]|nr:energy-coupling factor transporter transmembrane protein EcfT [Mycoplasmatota bacterium]